MNVTRIATVCVEGEEANTLDSTEDRIELMSLVAVMIRRRPGWAGLDAVLFPAAYYRVQGWYGPFMLDERLERLAASEAGAICTAAAHKLRHKSPGCLIVCGFDTRKRRGWRGDMMLAAFSPAGPVAVTRMIYPVAGDNNLVFEADADTQGRIVELASGASALLSVCYDAFALGEVAMGLLGRRGNLKWLGEGRTGRLMSQDQAVELLTRFAAQLRKAKPTVALVAIHRFAKPGRGLLWQRHGLATASAALNGGLVVGASHFLQALPATDTQSTLAACGVGRAHLAMGNHRPALEHRPINGFTVALPWASHVCALVRLYESA